MKIWPFPIFRDSRSMLSRPMISIIIYYYHIPWVCEFLRVSSEFLSRTMKAKIIRKNLNILISYEVMNKFPTAVLLRGLKHKTLQIAIHLYQIQITPAGTLPWEFEIFSLSWFCGEFMNTLSYCLTTGRALKLNIMYSQQNNFKN